VLDIARDLTRTADWQQFTKIGTITGDGVTTVFPKPIDMERMPSSAVIQDTVSFWGYRLFQDMNEFIYCQNRGFEPWPGGWIAFNTQFNFVPAPPAGSIAQYPYLTSNWFFDINGTPRGYPGADTDSFGLGDRLMILSLVWRWRQMKKLDWQGDQEIFTKARDEAWQQNNAFGTGVIRKNARTYYPGVQTAWPWTLGP
jgi:hypothetical protein